MINKLKSRINKKNLLLLCSLLFVCAVVILYISNYTLSVEHIELETDKLPESFDGYKIAHISDYHNNQSDLVTDDIIDQLKSEEPDIIFLTGDLIDFRITDIERSLLFIDELVEISPVYYVTGNHEAITFRQETEEYNELITGLKERGVTVLDNKSVNIENEEGDSFVLHGIDNQYFETELSSVVEKTHAYCSLLDIDEDNYNILLAHQPERIDVYSQYGFDAVFSGHAHGGQIRVFGQGLCAPDQGLFPEYTSGLYDFDGTDLLISRGLGDSLIPVRVFNRHHIIFAEIKTHPD